jgi:hypothetical protein
MPEEIVKKRNNAVYECKMKFPQAGVPLIKQFKN